MDKYTATGESVDHFGDHVAVAAQDGVGAACRERVDELDRRFATSTLGEGIVQFEVQTETVAERTDGLAASQRRARQHAPDGPAVQQFGNGARLIVSLRIEWPTDVGFGPRSAVAGLRVADERNDHGREE